MQFSENWLRSFVDTTLDTSELTYALTMSGLEVEELISVAPSFSNVVVAQIVSAEKHPDADRLQLLKVDIGGEFLQIVCGASNARAGLKAPCALVGAKLPGFEIKQAKVRGVDSYGMMCSAKELGLAEESEGLLEINENAKVGQDIRDFFDLNDQMITLKLTPNRSDCLSILGIAREISALTGAPLTLPDINQVTIQLNEIKNVHVTAPEACPLYCGRLIKGLNPNIKTPDWIKSRLERSGLRSINAIVDITNYVLLEIGQPMHAFDASKVQGDVSVRFASDKEKLLLLNQVEVELDKDMLVIADKSGPIALAGIMGGDSTSVSISTTDIFLESAFFSTDFIVGKARRLGLSTDSSYRFERGVDFGSTRLAIERATRLILDICGGLAGEVIEIKGSLPLRKTVKLRMEKLVSILGIDIDESRVSELFTKLGLSFTKNEEGFQVVPPSYRFDIAIEEDLIEEVARLYGYDKIPATPPYSKLAMLPSSERLVHLNALRDMLASNGYQEVITYSFVDKAWEQNLTENNNPIELKNPIASNLSVMRSSLWGGLVDTLIYNLNRKQERVRVFEIGTTYFKNNDKFHEKTTISGLTYGDLFPEQWSVDPVSVDFFDIKSDVERLTNFKSNFQAAEHPALHPGQTAEVMLHGRKIGWVGKLHPKWQQHYEIPGDVLLFELEVEPILSRDLIQYEEVSKVSPLRRDIALVVDESEDFGSILQTMRSADIQYVKEIELFDVYRGKGVPENKKSLAFLVVMQDTHRTLTDMEADAAITNLLQLVGEKHGATLR